MASNPDPVVAVGLAEDLIQTLRAEQTLWKEAAVRSSDKGNHGAALTCGNNALLFAKSILVIENLVAVIQKDKG